MPFAFLYLGFSIAIGIWASKRGRSGFGWGLLSLVISPLIAGILIVVMNNNAQIRCWQCAELILKQAIKCKHCGAEITTNVNYKDKQNTKLLSEKLIVTDWIVIFVLVVLVINLIYFETR